ncbi:type I secretion system permease/ATPase [Acidovorax sp. SRB_24]|uniref:type I secretion system permease/ATPase n=1 Tax=Acidovorax sp. SRB_24 TaxID=1962700 RepID=UPI001ED39A8A|nr:type I secretion system permease/ATPase [Acidovorax sp. SRB_24]NMM78531.1 type I secretion system permease/ATPase [Acidovorax sp. SRB_24]
MAGFFNRSELTRALWVFRRELAMVGAFSMVANLLLLTPTLYMLQVFDRVMLSRSEATLLALSLLALFFYLVGAFSEWMRSRVLVHAGLHMDAVLSTRVFNASFDAQLQEPGTQPAKAFSDLLQLRQFVTGQGALALFDAPWTPIYLAVLFMLHPMLGWVSIGFALVQLALVWFGHRQTVAPALAAQQAAGEASAYLQGKLRSVDVLEPMGMVHNLRPHWQARHAAALAAAAHSQEVTHRITAWSKFIRYSQQSLALAAGAVLVIDGQLSAGSMIAANVLMTRTLAPIDMLVGAWRGFAVARAAFARLEALLEGHPERDPALSRTAPEGAVRLADVVATAPGRAQPILKGVSLAVQPGSVTVVLGPSGSGKSTLARCLIGIWPLAGGEVLLDERPISGWSRDALGPYIGYLPQDVELFDGTIAENIARFGKVDSAQVIAAAEQTGLHQMILRFPKGYDTPIGDVGGFLSGGQRQRIGLARAVYGAPRLVVLDEPNANLDDEGEAALLSAVRALRAQGTAVVLVTHRPGALEVADRVVVMRDGQVHAHGAAALVMAGLQEEADTQRRLQALQRLREQQAAQGGSGLLGSSGLLG